jgi:signal transduction histidine kinase
VRQVLLNLLTNAAEAIAAEGGPGVIAITTGQATLDEHDLAGATFSAARPGPCCFVEVSDSGAGIADEVLGRIFEPFFSTKFTGRGLGLAAVQGIMRAHAGALFVRSAAGAGSSFRACFPVEGRPAR